MKHSCIKCNSTYEGFLDECPNCIRFTKQHQNTISVEELAELNLVESEGNGQCNNK